LFERHFESVARFFRNKAGANHDDLIQQTFLGCVESRDSFRQDSSFRTFLFGVARNVLGKHYRGAGRRTLDFEAVSVHDLGDSPSQVVARDREQQLLLQALRRIPLDGQIALELHYWESMTAAELAQVLGIPLGTAKTRLRRAKQLLENEVQQLSQGDVPVDPTGTRLETWARGLREMLFLDAK
jgi:RNA polymerase sigma factor (sigma-70 family)